MTAQRGRPRRIPKRIKDLIIRRALEKHDPPKPRLEVALDLIEEIKGMGAQSPTEETLCRMISEARNHEPSPRDSPWHLGALNDYELCPATVAKLLELKATFGWEMSIREAIWVQRLSAFLLDPAMLFTEAQLYAFGERVSEVSGNASFDTTELDRELAEMSQQKLTDEEEAVCVEDYKRWVADYEKCHSEEDIELFRKIPEPKHLSKILLLQYSLEMEGQK